MTTTPTKADVSDFNQQATLIIQLNYLGTGTISLSGKKPYHTTPTIDAVAKTITFKAGEYNYYGGSTQNEMIIHLSESPGYTAGETTFIWTSNSERSSIEDI